MTKLWVVAAALVLGGCATEFVPTGAGTDSFDQANGECYYRAYAVRNPYATYAVYEACMRGRGWRPK